MGFDGGVSVGEEDEVIGLDGLGAGVGLLLLDELFSGLGFNEDDWPKLNPPSLSRRGFCCNRDVDVGASLTLDDCSDR